MSVASILIPIATEVGAPIVKRALEKHLGSGAGKVGEMVIEAIAEELGSTPSSLPHVVAEQPKAVETAVRVVEADMRSVYEAEAANRAALIDAEKLEPAWTWAWRPLTMYLIGFLWLWALIGVHAANRFGAAMPSVDLAVLFNLTAIYMGLYMGGHTVKAVAQQLAGPR